MKQDFAIQLHFDGDIARNHLVSMRTLGKTLSHLQSAVDRAFLELHYGALWKHTRMPQHLWPEAELLIGPSQEGGYILDFLLGNRTTKAALERLNAALATAVERMTEEGVSRTENLAAKAAERREQIRSSLIKPATYDQLTRSSDPKIVRTYGDRAMVREIDQILAIIRSSAAGDSSFELTLATEHPMKYSFTKSEAVTFHEVVSRRQIGQPVIYTATIRSLDRVSKSAKIFNLEAKRQSNLYFATEDALLKLVPPFEQDQAVTFYGAPWIEYGAFDPGAGDILFISLVEDLEIEP